METPVVGPGAFGCVGAAPFARRAHHIAAALNAGLLSTVSRARP